MKTLYLHIGHGKTGSSYIQSSIAGSLNSLVKNGIYYPEVPGLNLAAKGNISSGNGSLLFGDVLFDREPGQKILTDSLLFSGEYIFERFYEELFVSNIRELCRRFEIEVVKILLFIRNPIEHAASIFQQSIKRGGRVHSIVECFESYDGPQKVADLLNQEFQFGPEIQITIKNYSYITSNILVHFTNWLGLPETALKSPQVPLINRSLTFGELEFQRDVNEILGPSGHLVSDRLCSRLSNIKADKIYPSNAIQSEMYNRLLPEIDTVNSKIPAEQHYKLELKTGVDLDSDEISFTREQIKLLAQGLAYEILRLSKL